MKKRLLLCLFALVLCATAFSQKPPEAVLSMFQQKFPQAKDVDWEKEKSGDWEAELELPDGSEMSVAFAADGRWLETETEITFAQLPAPVIAALQGKKVKEAARIEKSDGSTVYEVELKHTDLIFDTSGKLLK